jgi:hypothetical protein
MTIHQAVHRRAHCDDCGVSAGVKVRHIIFLCAALAGCVSAQVVNKDFSSAYSMAVPVCDLLSHPWNLVGHRVTVSGIYANDPHRRILDDPSCPSRDLEVWLGDSQDSLEVDRKMRRLLERNPLIGIRSVYSGLIKSDQLIAGCSDVDCFAFTKIAATLVSADWKLR